MKQAYIFTMPVHITENRIVIHRLSTICGYTYVNKKTRFCGTNVMLVTRC